jgi:hypothetical protein
VIEGFDDIRGGDLAVAHHHDPVGRPQHVSEQVRDQDAGLPAVDEAANEGQQLSGGAGVE